MYQEIVLVDDEGNVNPIIPYLLCTTFLLVLVAFLAGTLVTSRAGRLKVINPDGKASVTITTMEVSNVKSN